MTAEYPPPLSLSLSLSLFLSLSNLEYLEKSFCPICLFLLFAAEFALILPGIYFSFKLRNVIKDYAETKEILVTIYFFILIKIPALIIFESGIDRTPDIFYLAKSLEVHLTFGLTILLWFSMKVYRVLNPNLTEMMEKENPMFLTRRRSVTALQRRGTVSLETHHRDSHSMVAQEDLISLHRSSNHLTVNDVKPSPSLTRSDTWHGVIGMLSASPAIQRGHNKSHRSISDAVDPTRSQSFHGNLLALSRSPRRKKSSVGQRLSSSTSDGDRKVDSPLSLYNNSRPLTPLAHPPSSPDPSLASTQLYVFPPANVDVDTYDSDGMSHRRAPASPIRKTSHPQRIARASRTRSNGTIQSYTSMQREARELSTKL